MDARLEKLINAFEKKGWTLKGSVDISGDWWFQDILQLVSKWRPTETNIYLTLLTDPQLSDKNNIWSIGISSTIPQTKSFTYLEQITLNDIKKTDLDIFVDGINNVTLN